MSEVQAENRRLSEPLQKAQDQVVELQRQLSSYEKDQVLLAVYMILILTACLILRNDSDLIFFFNKSQVNKN